MKVSSSLPFPHGTRHEDSVVLTIAGVKERRAEPHNLNLFHDRPPQEKTIAGQVADDLGDSAIARALAMCTMGNTLLRDNELRESFERTFEKNTQEYRSLLRTISSVREALSSGSSAWFTSELHKKNAGKLNAKLKKLEENIAAGIALAIKNEANHQETLRREARRYERLIELWPRLVTAASKYNVKEAQQSHTEA